MWGMSVRRANSLNLSAHGNVCLPAGRACAVGHKRVLVEGRLAGGRLMGPVSTNGATSSDLERCPNRGSGLKVIAAIV